MTDDIWGLSNCFIQYQLTKHKRCKYAKNKNNNGITEYCFNVVFIRVSVCYLTQKHILAASKNLLLGTNISQFVMTGANNYSEMRLWQLIKPYAILRAEETRG